MEIDPGKINYGKMIQPQGNISAMDAGKKPDVQDQKVSGMPQNYNDTMVPAGDVEKNIFSEGVLLNGKKLFDMSLDMFKERLGKFLALIILAVVVLSIMDLAITLPFNLFFDSKAILKYNVVHLYLASALLSIIISVPSMILGISIIETIKDRNLDIRESIRGALGKFKDYISVILMGNFIYSCIILIIPAVAFIQFIASGGELSTLKSETWGMSFLIIIIGFLLILPLLYIIEIWIFITLIGVILDGLKPLESFSYGYELIKGKVARIFLRMISLSIRLIIYVIVIEIAFAAALGIPAGIIMGIAGQNSSVSRVVSYVMNLLSTVLDLGITSFVLVFQYNIYQNLKTMRKDLPQDYKTMHQGVIKTIAALGFLLTGLFLTALIYYAPVIDALFRKEVMTEEFMKKNGLLDEPVTTLKNEKTEDKKENVPPAEKKSDEASGLDSVQKRDAQRKLDLGEISLMVYNYKYTNGHYPISPATSKLNEENEIVFGIKSANGGNLPSDPKDPEYYYGYASPDGESFELTARLESLNDPGCDKNIKSFCLYRIRY